MFSLFSQRTFRNIKEAIYMLLSRLLWHKVPLMGSFLCFSLLALPQAVRAESFALVRSNDFSTPLNSSEWNIYNNSPFGSSSNTCFKDSNSFTKSGLLNLVINLVPNSCPRLYSSGGLDTYLYNAQNYGKWEVRARFPAGTGVTGYIGLFVADGSSWPPEIDFAEVIGRDPTALYLSQHYTLSGSNQNDTFKYTQARTDWTAGYNTYILEWVPGQLRYYVNGSLVLTQTQKFDLPVSGMKLAIGTGTGDCGSWVDCPSSKFQSAKMLVDYVKIYQYIP
jgi:beta-glucanase (GH16 family)